MTTALECGSLGGGKERPTAATKPTAFESKRTNQADASLDPPPHTTGPAPPHRPPRARGVRRPRGRVGVAVLEEGGGERMEMRVEERTQVFRERGWPSTHPPTLPRFPPPRPTGQARVPGVPHLHGSQRCVQCAGRVKMSARSRKSEGKATPHHHHHSPLLLTQAPPPPGGTTSRCATRTAPSTSFARFPRSRVPRWRSPPTKSSTPSSKT